MDLVPFLVQQLGINEEQAKGGAGLLLNLVKEKLGGDFSEVEAAIPNAQHLIQDAPTDEAGGGGLMGAIGGLASKLGVDTGGFGDFAGLAGGFQQLGLDSSMIQKFVPTLLEYVEKFGGENVKNLLAGLLAGKK